MANHSRNGNAMHNPLDALNIPVLGISVASWPFLPWLLAHMPTPAIAYMALSGAFMVFQMCDKLGWLERLKRKQPKG